MAKFKRTNNKKSMNSDFSFLATYARLTFDFNFLSKKSIGLFESRRSEIRHQRSVQNRFLRGGAPRRGPFGAVCPPPHKIRSHHGGVSCTRRRMAKRERCTFLLHLFSLAAVNSFMHSRGTTLPPDFKVGRPSGAHHQKT